MILLPADAKTFFHLWLCLDTLDEPADLEGLAASTRKADRALKQLNDAIQRDQHE